jgi:hypothetical protein
MVEVVEAGHTAPPPEHTSVIAFVFILGLCTRAPPLGIDINECAERIIYTIVPRDGGRGRMMNVPLSNYQCGPAGGGGNTVTPVMPDLTQDGCHA